MLCEHAHRVTKITVPLLFLN